MPRIFSSSRILLATSKPFLSPHSHRPLQPSLRQFSTSNPIMAIKTYFDLTWEGPVLDANNRATSEVKRMLLLDCPTSATTLLPSCYPLDGFELS